MEDYLKTWEQELSEVDEEALKEIARLSDGGMKNTKGNCLKNMS